MRETDNFIPIGQNWVNLNSLASISSGKSVYIQNIGIPGDLISIAISKTEPQEPFFGVALNQLNPMVFVEDPVFDVWVKFYRFDSLDNYPNIKSRIQVFTTDNALKFSFGGNSSTDNNSVVQSVLNSINDVSLQLRLMNARIEEAFETRIKQEDVRQWN